MLAHVPALTLQAFPRLVMFEKAPRESNSQLQDELKSNMTLELSIAALGGVADSVFLFNSEKRLVFANSPAQELQSNFSRLRLGSKCCEMFWQTGENDGCVVDRAMDNGYKIEFEIPAHHSHKIPLFIKVQPLDAGEKPFGALVVAHDISELRRAEAEAISHKSFMANLADRSPDEIYALDKRGRITWVNKRAESGNPIMLVGQRLIDFIVPENKETVSGAIERALTTEDTQAEIRAIRPDETARDVEAYTSPLWKDGEVDGVLVFLRDITERKRTQELVSQSDKLRAVGELAAGVAHNLNNSLTVIKGRSQLLQMRASDESSLKSLQVINEAVEDGSKTLRRILEFARRDTSLEFAPVELDELITSSIEIARPKWQRKSSEHAIHVKVETNGPIYVKGEIAELREVVLNLIFNAVDAMPEGGIMEVGSRGEIDSGCFWVADTGCGMPAETVARIFEPFFTTKGSKGTGLGLSASHGIISRHGGEIFAVSEPSEGTRFEVRLPIADDLARFVRTESGPTESNE
jgi:PAS domain S-box-containing protein